MLNSILKKYDKVTKDMATSLRIPLVHVRGDSLHLWSLEICDEKLYAFQRIYEAKIPMTWNEKAEVLTLGTFAQLFRDLLSCLATCIKKMKQEHDDARVKLLMGMEVEADDLSTFVNLEIWKTVRGPIMTSSCFSVTVCLKKDFGN